ncbi:hypothetical protein OHB12_32640 [Nocardia sp. NBC_01730]|nr:hypothetical protein OHB12_32640 [Nocardia sp. NBC_01730]
MIVYTEPDGGRYQEVRRYAFGRTGQPPDPIGITIDTAPARDQVD